MIKKNSRENLDKCKGSHGIISCGDSKNISLKLKNMQYFQEDFMILCYYECHINDLLFYDA